MEDTFEGILETSQTATLKELFLDVIRIQDIIKEHIKLAPIVLPYHAEDKNRILTIYELPCNHCGYPLIDMRGTIVEQFGTIVVTSEGFCLDCNQLSNSLMRWHQEGHWTGKVNGEWVMINPNIPKISILAKIKNFLFP